jgi:hypothetical protein
MTFQAWISEAATPPPFTEDDASDWQQVGEIDSTGAPDLVHEIQKALGLRKSWSASTSGYISGDSRSDWVREADDADASRRFWLAINVTHGPRLISVQPARFTPHLKRRKPEPHPGLIYRQKFLGVHLVKTPTGAFRRLDTP